MHIKLPLAVLASYIGTLAGVLTIWFWCIFLLICLVRQQMMMQTLGPMLPTLGSCFGLSQSYLVRLFEEQTCIWAKSLSDCLYQNKQKIVETLQREPGWLDEGFVSTRNFEQMPHVRVALRKQSNMKMPALLLLFNHTSECLVSSPGSSSASCFLLMQIPRGQQVAASDLAPPRYVGELDWVPGHLPRLWSLWAFGKWMSRKEIYLSAIQISENKILKYWWKLFGRVR